MAIPHRLQVFSRLRIRYLLRHNHVNNLKLVQPNFCTMSEHRWLCFHPLQHREMAFRWLHHFLLLIGGYFSNYQPYSSSNFRPQLAYESRKAKIIIASRDISYAFTNVMANNYYSLRRFELLSDSQVLLTSFIRFLQSFLFL